MSRHTKVILSLVIIFIFFIIVYAIAVTHPNNTISQKACTSWGMVNNKWITLTHEREVNNSKLPDGFTVKPGTAKQVPVLMYHYITPRADNKEPGNNSIITLEAFEKGMKYLYDQGYYTATMNELEQYVQGKLTLPLKTVVITFDDGYQNNIIYAYPILKKYGFHATIFVIGNKVAEHAVPFEPTQKSFLSRDEMKSSADVFEYHSHTYDLHRKNFIKCGRKTSSGLDVSKITKDISRMKESGIDSPYFAYPFGEKSTQMIYYLQKNGYRMGFSVRQGRVKPGDRMMNLNRLTVTSKTDLSELFQSYE